MYPRVARAWAVVFALAGISFALAPSRVGAAITAAARLVGLGGEIAAPAGNLWHVLALSLMVAVTGLAWESARHPASRSLFGILLAAKLASTAGFAFLGATVAPAYWVAALGDGFVAATLWLAWWLSAPRADAAGLARRYSGESPFYEVWFGKLDLVPGRAFWFRYTLLDGASREAGTWAIWFESGRGVVADRAAHALEDLAPGGVFGLAESRLDACRAVGRAGAISWDLAIRGRGRAFDHVPLPLKCLGLARSRYASPLCDVRFDGTLRVGDREIAVRDATGMIGHIEGTKSGHSWAWAHCNAFAGAPDAVFEGLSARIALGPGVSPPLSSFVLWLDGHRYAFSSTLGLLRATSRITGTSWTFSAGAGGATLEGDAAAADPGDVAVVTYTDTDGSQLWCRNSKLATLRIRLRDPARGIDRTLEARGTAAFEIVDRERPAGPVTI